MSLNDTTINDLNDYIKKMTKPMRLDIPKFPQIDPMAFHHEVPDFEIIDPEDTIMGDIKQKIQE